MDAIPVACALLQFAGLILVYAYFPALPFWALLAAGAIYSVSISWNLNGIAHNFIHNPYFRSHALNRAFSLLESLTLGISQAFYDCVHMRHHQGNSDKPSNGDTVDWLSIYRHGHDGEAENVWSYMFLSYFRDDPKAIYREIAKKNPEDARWGIFEIVAFVLFYGILFVFNWHFLLWFLPFYYFGHCLSHLNGYYEHFAGNPDKPIAWGVSTYNKLYNLTWFNNGYHAEHHYRPKLHWTKMKQFHEIIAEEQQREGVRVIRPPHALGFLDPDLPEQRRPLESMTMAQPSRS
jgi:fatty acid desaturase